VSHPGHAALNQTLIIFLAAPGLSLLDITTIIVFLVICFSIFMAI
jgi:hypothetical protein